MKKIYNAPQTISLEVKMQPLMFGSNDDGTTMSGGGNRGDYSGTGQLGREGDLWDDEDF